MASTKFVKEAALDLPKGHPLREVILGEPDQVPVEEYLAKSKVWFKLLKIRAA